MYGLLAIILLIGVVVISTPNPLPKNDEIVLPKEQEWFLSRISSVQEAASATPNSLAFNELINLRDNELTRTSSVEVWSGTVLGIQKMQGKGAVSIDIGGARVLAGVHLTYGLDTLVRPSQSAVYKELLLLRRGDNVQFSGRFSIHNGSLVEMSYTGSGTISTPEFLFEFSAIMSTP